MSVLRIRRHSSGISNMLQKITGNPYLYGFLIFLTEIIINLPFGKNVLSGALIALFAGMVYAHVRKEKMPHLARLKTTFTYIALVAVIGVIVVLARPTLDPNIIVIVGGLILIVYGLFLYFALWWGGWIQMKGEERRQKALAKKAAKAAASSAP